jgi:RNA recognition motif-containing protein
MATKDLEPTASEEQQAASSSKKRKSALTEIQVDLSLPEPPSKKARRALKKGKQLPAKPASSDDEGEGGDSNAAGETKKDGAKAGKKKERSPHGVWIGNLRFTVTKAELRKWLVDNSGGSITDNAITRVHMPTTKKPAPGAPNKTTAENRGFAYVDFASFEANVAAIALSETEMNGRKLLIKDSKSFEGRPKKEEVETGTDAAGVGKSNGKITSGDAAKAKTGSSTKIFVGNLSFNTTEDDLHAHFEKCGKIRWIKVATFEDSGKCKGYGWVNFEEPEAAQWAVKGFVKVRETVETVEDFMEVDGEEGDPPSAEGPKKAQDDTEGDGDKGEGGDEGKKGSKKNRRTQEPPRTRTRKWWVNQLLGRNLKIELAEDDQTRYKKRYGKGAKQRQNSRSDNAETAGGGGSHDNNADGDDEDDKTAGKKAKPQKEKEIKNYHTDISVARLTGAVVAPQGKKTTFDD